MFHSADGDFFLIAELKEDSANKTVQQNNEKKPAIVVPTLGDTLKEVEVVSYLDSYNNANFKSSFVLILEVGGEAL